MEKIHGIICLKMLKLKDIRKYVITIKVKIIQHTEENGCMILKQINENMSKLMKLNII